MPDPDLGPCINPLHVGKCPGYAPGKKLGRDSWPSCLYCTCHPATHKPRNTDERKVHR